MHTKHTGILWISSLESALSHQSICNRCINLLYKFTQVLCLRSERTAPPPTKIYGFFDALIISTAVFRSSSSDMDLSFAQSALELFTAHILSNFAVTSFGISISTGPGLPVLAITKCLTDCFCQIFHILYDISYAL